MQTCRQADKAKYDTAMKKLEQGYHRPSEIFENPPGQYQPSTVDVINEKTGEDFWCYVGRFFEVNDIGEGVTRVRVLKKKVGLE